ncbi:MAG: dihydroorotate dehydrogenase electron transfer subunit [Eggerthellaceae bacterium]|nr:dihydroorotate dehydrogenase electron transfer subunit [Eggerthellaceae bacterium]
MPVIQRDCTIVAHKHLTGDLWRLELKAAYIAPLVKPGQFVHLRIPGFEQHILRRPFSVYQVDVEKQAICIIYRVVGKGTKHMTELAVGTDVDLIGPTGRPWRIPEGAKKILVIGAGVGAAPVYLLTEEACACGIDVSVVLGAQTHEELIFEDEYRALGANVVCTTDDGSYGIAGFCTDAAKDLALKAQDEGAPFEYCAVCGPLPVMRITAGFTRDMGIPCEVSMEKRMACGIGACLSCVLDTIDGKKRACVDGPVFDANEVEW